MIEIVLVIILLIWNFGVSAWNAYAVGSSWARIEATGGLFGKIMLWCGWLMSAIGFTWCYLFLIGFIMYAVGWLDQEAVSAMFSLGYLIIIIPALGTGLIITINSWINAYHERSVGNFAIATYNTSAQFYNSYRALSAIPEALKSVIEFFGKGMGGSSGGKRDGKGAMGILVIIALIIAIALGVFTTQFIADWAADRAEINSRKK